MFVIVNKVLEKTTQWPLPDYEPGIEPLFVFLLTPPYSGSTAIAKFLATAPQIGLLQKKGEGQWLVPGLSESDRWDANKPVNYSSVKAVWLSAWQNLRTEGGGMPSVVIEKSPPNLVRIKRLARLFKSVSFIANNRDPFANCASVLTRQHNPGSLSQLERRTVMKNLAKAWIMRSKLIQILVQDLNCPFCSYEEFCKKPASLLDKLELPKSVVSQIDLDPVIKVKDYKPQNIANQNSRQIKYLNESDFEVIGETLDSHKQLVEFFGYRSSNPTI